MYKPSRRALVIAASFALGLSAVGPAAHAGLLGGDDSDTAIEGVGLPVGGDLLGGDGLLGGVLGGSGGGPLDLVSGVLGGEDSVLAMEGLVEVVEILPLGVVPGGESVLGVLDAFSDSGSIVPGLQVLDDFGVLGILGSL